MADDDIVIDPEVEEKKPEAEAKVVTPDEGIEALKKKLGASEAARAQAEAAAREADRRAREASSVAVDARKEKLESDLAVVTNAIETGTANQTIYEENYATAAAAGDWAEAAKYQRLMAENAANLVFLKAEKPKLEAKAKEPPEPEVRPITDPVEALAVQLSPQSGAWVRAHPDFARDPAKFQQMIGADSLARGKGFTPDTPEYFAEVESILGLRQKEAPKQEEDILSAASEARDTPPSAAPVRRDSPNGARVTLTKDEREMAEALGMTPEEYAKNKLALQKEGRIH